MPASPKPDLTEAARRVLALADDPRAAPLPADADAEWQRAWADAFETLRSAAAQAEGRS